jgi:hypothetical protein
MDLFPGIEKPNVNYGTLLDAIQQACQSPESWL